MTVWKKLDVQGDLNPIVAKARGKIAKIYQGVGQDLYITSQREGIHGIISLHPDGWAFDCRLPFNVTKKFIQRIKSALGPDFDIIVEHDHLHIEYDPDNFKNKRS